MMLRYLKYKGIVIKMSTDDPYKMAARPGVMARKKKFKTIHDASSNFSAGGHETLLRMRKSMKKKLRIRNGNKRQSELAPAVKEYF